MVEEDSNTIKTTKISLTGDKEKCGHCREDDKKLQDYSKVASYTYEYTDVNSDRGQEQLRSWGVGEGKSVDIPITKVETCETSKEGNKKCKTYDWRDSYWDSLAKGQLPDEVTKVD